MIIDHGAAITLETIVRKVHSCDRTGMGGFIDADHFEHSPFDAALIALAPIWKRADFHEIEDFLFKWEHLFRDDDNDEPIDVELYVDELNSIVNELMNQ